MRSFKDEMGRTWLVALNTAAAKRVRATCDGMNLLDVTQIGEIAGRLCQDVVLLTDVCWAIVQPDAVKQSITEDQFCAAIGGQHLTEMRAALVGAIRDFFQNDRPEVAAGLQKMTELLQQAGPVLIRQIEGMTLEKALAAVTAATSTSSTSSTTPAATPSTEKPPGDSSISTPAS